MKWVFHGYVHKENVPTHTMDNKHFNKSTYLFVAATRQSEEKWMYFHTTLDDVIRIIGHGNFDAFIQWTEKMDLQRARSSNFEEKEEGGEGESVELFRFYAIKAKPDEWVCLSKRGTQMRFHNELDEVFNIQYASNTSHEVNRLNWNDTSSTSITGLYWDEDFSNLIICYKVKLHGVFSLTKTAMLSNFHSSIASTFERRLDTALLSRITGRSKGNTRICFGQPQKVGRKPSKLTRTKSSPDILSSLPDIHENSYYQSEEWIPVTDPTLPDQSLFDMVDEEVQM
jgi:hypothetical protein